MRKLSFVLILMCAVSAAAADSCAKCYFPPYIGEDPYCGQTTYNGAETCEERADKNGCDLTGSCAGPTGDDSRIKYLWACGPKLPEKAAWVVVAVRVEHKPERQRVRS
jgi:hypothetical protein